MKTQEKNSTNKTENPFKIQWNGVPATVKWSMTESSLYESVASSVVCHILGFLLIWFFAFIFAFFGITTKIFPKPKEKVQDIQFVLKTPYHHRIKVAPVAARETSSGGNNTAIKKVEPKTEPKTVNSAQQKEKPKKVAIIPQNIFSHNNNVKSKTISRKTGKSHSKAVIPDFSSSMPTSGLKSMTSGLSSSSGSGIRHHASGFDSSSASVGGIGSGSSAGRGGAGHGGFDKTTTQKMISSYDISPYVNELRRNVRWNWKAPKNGAGKRVELFLRIAKDGRLIILNVKTTSESGEVDNAALNAVRKCLPLNPLPAKYSKHYLDVVFTFSSGSVGSRF